MISVLIIDDHRLFAESLAAMLNQETDLQVVGICTIMTEVSEAIRQKNPTIVLLDINLNQTETGIALCSTILGKYPHIKVIALSMYHEYRHVNGMINAGAMGYVQKNATKETLINAICAVNNGQAWFDTAILKRLKPLNRLTNDIVLKPREREILEKIHVGKTTRTIAEELHLSIKTVEFYRNSLMIKFDAKNVVELVNKSQNHFG